jgi:hypothetical protein
VVNLAGAKIGQRITGLAEPRGLARAPTDNRLYVSTSAGKLMIYAGAPLKPEGSVDVGANPGLLYYDAGSERIYLDLAGRKIAIIDSTHNKHWDNIRLDAEPGAMALEDGGSRIFVAALGEPRILVADRDGNKQTGSWSTGANGPAASIALDEDGGRLLAAFRQPAVLAWFDLADGTLKGSIPACAEPGQLISDSFRHRAYLTCADGKIQAFSRDAAGAYADIGSVPTEKGAIKAVLVPTSGRLYLGVPAGAAMARSPGLRARGVADPLIRAVIPAKRGIRGRRARLLHLTPLFRGARKRKPFRSMLLPPITISASTAIAPCPSASTISGLTSSSTSRSRWASANLAMAITASMAASTSPAGLPR